MLPEFKSEPVLSARRCSTTTIPIEKLIGVIHIYGGDFFEVHRSEWDPETLTERDWDIKSAMQLFSQSNERFFSGNANPFARECTLLFEAVITLAQVRSTADFSQA